MTTYTLYEKQNLNSTRKSSTTFSAKTLTAAKIKATKEQCFQGTVLELRVNDKLIAFKEDGVWENCF